MTSYSYILKYLKGHPGVKASELVRMCGTRFPLREVAQAIDELRQKPWVTATDLNGTDFTLTIPVVFHPMQKRGDAGTWNWNVTRAQSAVPLPDHFASIYEADIAWRDQGNAGTCFPGSAEVLMEDFTYKRIAKVRVGDRVITHLGNVKRVTETMQRKWQGNNIAFKVYGLDTKIECTPEHPILTANGWVSAKDLTKDDLIAIPLLKNLVSDKTRWSFEKDPDFLWVLGLYLAEGNLDTHRVCFTLGSSEMAFADRIKSTMSRYGANVTINTIEEQHRINVGLQGVRWVQVFKELGNEYCDGKEINHRLMTLEPELQKCIFAGWCARDGHYKEKRKTYQIVTTSPKLLRQMQHILLRNGIRGNAQVRTKYQGKKDSYCLEVPPRVNGTGVFGDFSLGYYHSKIRTLDKSLYYGENVYNLDVDDDHSYIVNTIAVHNCVGQATSELFDAHYQRMMRDSGSADIPTTADRQMEQHNIPVFFDTGRSSYFDKYWRQSFAAAGIYEDARQTGNVTPATGAYVSDSIHALKTIGIGMDWQWQNLKCGNARYDFPYPGIDPESNEKYYDTAKLHRITGYARLATVDEVKQAIYQYGGVLGAVEVYENYLDCKMDGHFPDPKGSSVGGHALFFYGWSGDNLLFRHSWRDAGFPKTGSLSSRYFERAAIDFYVPIDDAEVQIARQIYASMTAVGMGLPDDATVTLIINSGTPVTGKAAGVKVALVDGAKYHLRLIDTATGRTVDLDYVVASVDKYIVFKFESSPGNPTNPPPAPKLSFKARLQAAIKAMLEKAKCKKYGK
jgi:hypothetical protein